MRLFLLLAFAFALISLALVVSQHPAFIEQTRQLVGTPVARDDADENVTATNERTAWTEHFEYTTTIGLQDDGWQALSGFPSFVKLNFPLPRKANLTDGRLRLRLNTQLIEGAAGSLRIAVNDQRRAEVVLTPGQEQRTLLLALTPQDLGRPVVTVSLAAQGDAFKGVCPSRPARGAVIDVLPGSGVDLAHVEPLSDPFDVWLASSKPTRILLGTEDSASVRADRLLLAARLKQASVRADFVAKETDDKILALEDRLLLDVDRKQSASLRYDSELGFITVKDPNAAHSNLTMTAGQRLVDIVPGAVRNDVHDVVTSANDTKAVNFFRSFRWRLRYNLVEREGGSAPARLQLALRVGVQELGADWLVHVMLNNSILTSERLNSTAGTFTKTVALPAALLEPENEVTIDLVSSAGTTDHCDPGLEMTAQLLPDSKLEGKAFLTSDAPVYVIEALGRSETVLLSSVPVLNAAQSASTADLLAHILPQNVQVNTDEADGEGIKAKIQILDGTGLEMELKRIDLKNPSKRFWIVSEEAGSDDVERHYEIIPITPQSVSSETSLIHETAIYLLIEA